MLIGAGDVYIASLHSTKTVAAIGVANGFINPIFLFGIGLMMGVSPLLAIKLGKGEKVRNSLGSIMAYSFGAGIVLSLITTIFGETLVELIGIEPELVEPVTFYMSVVAWSFPFALAFQAGKEYLQAFEEVVAPNLMALAAVALNVVVNYVLVFGVGSYEGMDEKGLAVASLIIRIVLCIALLLYLSREKWGRVSWLFIKDVMKFGYPVAFMFFMEVLAFCAVSVLSGKLGVVQAATNNIIMTLSSITFMIPLSISSAVAVKVGNAYGSKKFIMVDLSSKAALFITLMFTSFSAAAFYFFPAALMSITTTDSEVIRLGVNLLFVVALFQIVDGLQVTLAGILRGVDKTVTTSIMVFVGYWLFGIPMGAYLSFEAGMGVMGLWIGLASSLGVLATGLGILAFYVRKQLKETF
ncbi:MAG: MATE family efflux transporter [Bacteriovoracaceae bacterium]|nr:MATE family efflux transporter [Bacteriovoracaceae bacterium]